MTPEEIKIHACAFADWKREYDSIETFEFNRMVKKMGGTPSVKSEETGSVYDKWVNRSVMTYDEAMQLVSHGYSVTRPRFWAVHRGYFKNNENGKLTVFTEYLPNGRLYTKDLSYSDDVSATDWMKIEIK